MSLPEPGDLLFHGTGLNRNLSIHEGQCFTDDILAAADYSTQMGMIYVLRVVGLPSIQEVDGFDSRYGGAPADDPDFREECHSDGYDLIYYWDITPDHLEHQTLRIVSEEGVKSMEVLGSLHSRELVEYVKNPDAFLSRWTV